MALQFKSPVERILGAVRGFATIARPEKLNTFQMRRNRDFLALTSEDDVDLNAGALFISIELYQLYYVGHLLC